MEKPFFIFLEFGFGSYLIEQVECTQCSMLFDNVKKGRGTGVDNIARKDN